MPDFWGFAGQDMPEPGDWLPKGAAVIITGNCQSATDEGAYADYSERRGVIIAVHPYWSDGYYTVQLDTGEYILTFPWEMKHA
jgi:hypothetical protein